MREYKIVVLGAGGVGKSALTVRFVQGMFVESYDPTIEDSYKKEVTVDQRYYCLEILDTAGIEQFTAMRELYIRNSEGFVLTYSVNSRSSFEELKTLRSQVARMKENPNVPMVLVGNKCDLPNACREVPVEEARALAASWGKVPFFETSAKTGANVDELFHSVVRQLARRDSAFGLSLRNSSIYSSLDSDSQHSRRHGSNTLRMKQSLARLREKKSIKRLVSMTNLNLKQSKGGLRQRASQFFARKPSHTPHHAFDLLPADIDPDIAEMASFRTAYQIQPTGTHSRQASQTSIIYRPGATDGLNLSAAPEIPTVATKKGKCSIM